jgi:cytochrome P450
LRPKAWTFVPFNGGPRICMGQMFALTQIYYIVTRMFQNFGTVRLIDPSVKPKMKVAITLIPSTKLQVVFENPTGLTWD